MVSNSHCISHSQNAAREGVGVPFSAHRSCVVTFEELKGIRLDPFSISCAFVFSASPMYFIWSFVRVNKVGARSCLGAVVSIVYPLSSYKLSCCRFVLGKC